MPLPPCCCVGFKCYLSPAHRIIVVLEKMIRIYNFTRIPQELHRIETASNPRGKWAGRLLSHPVALKGEGGGGGGGGGGKLA